MIFVKNYFLLRENINGERNLHQFGIVGATACLPAGRHAVPLQARN